MLKDALGWFAALLPLAVAGIVLGSALWTRRAGAKRASTGSIGAFDEIWAPGAAEARAIWEIEQELPVEAPSPQDDEGRRFDLDSGRVVVTPQPAASPRDPTGPDAAPPIAPPSDTTTETPQSG